MSASIWNSSCDYDVSIIYLRKNTTFDKLKKHQNHELRYRKFSAVLGAISAKSSILMRPAGMLPMVMSKNTIGFLGFGGLWCHSTPPPPTDAINRNIFYSAFSLDFCCLNFFSYIPFYSGTLAHFANLFHTLKY